MLLIPSRTRKSVASQALRAYAYQCEKDAERNKGTFSEPIFRKDLANVRALLARFEGAQHAAE
jgi:hypothetical protein